MRREFPYSRFLNGSRPWLTLGVSFIFLAAFLIDKPLWEWVVAGVVWIPLAWWLSANSKQRRLLYQSRKVVVEGDHLAIYEGGDQPTAILKKEDVRAFSFLPGSGDDDAAVSRCVVTANGEDHKFMCLPQDDLIDILHAWVYENTRLRT